MELQPPPSESYIPAPDFEYAISQRENDYAMYVASGADRIDALITASIISAEEAQYMPRGSLLNMATTLLNSPPVDERYQYYRQLHIASVSSTVERMEQEAASIAYADFALAFDPTTGAPITNPHDLPRHLRAAIKEFKIDKDGVVHIKYHDKLKAMQMLGDLNGHFNEAHAAKAPQVTINLDTESAHAPPTIDVTPTATATPLPACLE